MNRLTTRQWGLFGMLFLVAVAAADWKAGEPVPAVKKAKAYAASPSRPAGQAGQAGMTRTEVPAVRLDSLGERVASDAEMVDVFKSKSWYVPPPPPPPPKPVPPPPPTAPPLPYVFMGSYLDAGGRLIIFLTRGERVFSVSPGDTIENTYRVDGVASGQLGLTYLPLNIKQTMTIREPS